MTSRNPDIRPCQTCGRRTRPKGVKSAVAPGTVAREGAHCSVCAPKKVIRRDLNPRMPISRSPLTDDERKVAQLMRDLSETPEEADDLLAMLGLVREVTE